MAYKKIIRAIWILFCVLLMNFCFAATFSLGKLGLQYTGPLFLLGIRMLIGGIILLSYYALVTPRARMHLIAKNDWYLMLKIVLFYNVFSYVLEFWALQYMSPLKTNMLWSILPFVSALLGYFLLDEKLTRFKWWGLLIGTAGMVPMMLVPDEYSTRFGDFFSISLPELAMFVEVVTYAYGGYLAKRLFDRGYPIVLVNGLCLIFSALIILPMRLMLLPIHPYLYSELVPTLLYATLLALVSEVIGYGIYGYLLRKKYTITFLSFSGLLCPIFGAVMSKYIFNETLYGNYMIAFFFIMAGLFLFYREELVEEILVVEAAIEDKK